MDRNALLTPPLTFGDVQRLVREKVPESLKLEYKSGRRPSNKDRFKDDIAQDISAFANSAGGTLIIGVTDSIEIDGVDVESFSLESLGQVIASKIAPTIPGLRIEMLTGSQGESVIVVHSPASMSAPHQGPRHTYYRRYDRHTQPMAHHEIEDVRRRQIAVSPLVVVSTATRGSVLTAVDIRNSGAFPASDIVLTFSSDYIWPHQQVPIPIRDGIAHLGPGQHLRFRGQNFQAFAEHSIRAVFDVRVEYTHAGLQQRISHVWPLDFESYRESMSVLSEEQQERRDALEEIRKIRRATEGVARCLDESLRKLVGANGLDLSVYTLRNLQTIVLGGSIEKLSPQWLSADGFAAALGVSFDVGQKLEILFRDGRTPEPEQISSILDAELFSRFDQTFEVRPTAKSDLRDT